MDLLSLRYHMILQRFTFSELQHLNANTRLATLLTAKSILITNTSASNFTLDDSPITQPDVYTTNAVPVHGIKTLLDYNIYGDDDGLKVSLPIPQPRQPRRLLQETVAPPLAASTTSNADDHGHSSVERFSCEFSMVFMVVFIAFAAAYED
jgi:hypothetical protein